MPAGYWLQHIDRINSNRSKSCVSHTIGSFFTYTCTFHNHAGGHPSILHNKNLLRLDIWYLSSTMHAQQASKIVRMSSIACTQTGTLSCGHEAPALNPVMKMGHKQVSKMTGDTYLFHLFCH